MEQPSNRQLKVGETIKRELSQVFTKDLSEPFLENLFITVSEVRMSPDLKNAEVYIVPMLGKVENSNKLVESLNGVAYKIRDLINKKVKLRFSPQIKFKYDNSYENAQKLNSLLNE